MAMSLGTGNVRAAANGPARLRDLLIPVGILLVLASILFPLPAFLLDCLLVINLILAVSLLITTLSISDPLKLSTLPTLLLLATMYRLALNISTTRLILGTGQAGETIEAFGHLVIQGNLVVGAVVFLVITLVQFVVIAKGSERVAEVAARFTLDALPGKQMSIDADVRAGLIDHESARRKRDELQSESRFYGALDGAMKFVKGDAIAGLAIVVVNILAGIAVGVIFQKLSIANSVKHFSLLTIGDGLAAQIPALLNSLAAGVVVTRVVRADEASVSSEMLSQIGQSPRVLFVSGSFALVVALIPAMPHVPLLALGATLVISAAIRSRQSNQVSESLAFQPRIPAVLGLSGSVSFFGEFAKRGGIQELERWRGRVYEQSGLILLRPEIYSYPGEVLSGKILYRGIELAALTIEDPALIVSDVIKQLDLAVTKLRDELIDDQLTRRLLDQLDLEAPELVANTVPTVVSVTQLTEVLRSLARERLSLRSFDVILQALAFVGSRVRGERALVGEVRVALRRMISARFADQQCRILGYTLDPALDMAIARYEREGILLDSKIIQQLVNAIRECPGTRPLIVCSRTARAAVREFLAIHSIDTDVIAFEEIADGYTFIALASLAGEPAQAALLQELAA